MRLCLLLLFLLLSGGVQAQESSLESPPGSLRVMTKVKATLGGRNFDIKALLATKSGERARLELLPKTADADFVVLELLPKLNTQGEVELALSVKVDIQGKVVERDIRIKTLLGTPGFFAVRDKLRGESLEVELTPTLKP